ncbi:PspC domain-containing protein [Parahaliea sp. F7430]|uniref:PspC domain-containing protein n=1 Tax=Sediminihaliea albiluteola TaxID=2758564 RepID=A0A7W2TV24_9GAMM|nr:PspC domain-containing protein [Sediminihaliea albiluteola]MBA6412497.1 PspC domain-containing protein [Sediminihaliea albiluteola]
MAHRNQQGQRSGPYATNDYGQQPRRAKFRLRKSAGWGMNLYRNTRRSRVAGVAAGLADYLDVAHWVVRLLWVAAFLFTGTLALWAYLGAWLLLAPRPASHWGDDGSAIANPLDDPQVEMEYDERYHSYRPRKVFQYSEPGSVRLQRARERLDAALQRVEAMESYVTSRQYELNKELSKL